MRERELLVVISRLTGYHLKPVLGLNSSLGRSCMRSDAIRLLNIKDFFHSGRDYSVRSAEIHSLGRRTKSNYQVWCGSVNRLCQDHDLRSQISSTVLFTSSLASVRLTSNTALLVRRGKALSG